MTVEQSFLAFTLAAALLTVAPGPDTALVLRTAISGGSKRAYLVGLGIATGCMAWGVMVAVGLGALITASQTIFTLLKWIGAGYLVFLGVTMLASRSGKEKQEPHAASDTSSLGFRRGLLTNLLNPKVGAFYVSFLPQFIPDGVDVAPMTVALAAIHACLGLAWFAAIISATRPIATLFAKPGIRRWIDRTIGAVLIGFGVRLALSGRQ